MTGGGTEGVVGGEDDGGGAVVEEFEEGELKSAKEEPNSLSHTPNTNQKSN